ncbi:MAG: class I SAM-dependent methyltransferase [Bacteroidota bacterium]
MRNYKYNPASHEAYRIMKEGDIVKARTYYFSEAPLNLKFLIEKRFSWINKHINQDGTGIEVGSGIGLSNLFVKCRNYSMTDNTGYEWLDTKHINYLESPYSDNSFDFVVCSNLIHKLADPSQLFIEMNRILKPGGKLVIQDVNASWGLRKVLRMTHREGYDFTRNVFTPLSSDTDKMHINCAIPNLLFDDSAAFKCHFPFFEIEHSKYSECFILLNSGGVVNKSKCIRLPWFLLKLVNRIDNLLIRISPMTFAMQRQIVLRKV